MKFSLSFPQNGTTKTVQVQNANSWRHFLQKRMGQEVQADSLGDQFKGYVFKISGGFDKDGFAMKQGIMSNGRVRLLLKPGAKCYRARRVGERKRKSVRGCIVGPDIAMLSCIVVKKGEQQIAGLTDQVKPRRLGPKRASGIRKLFSISRGQNEKSTSIAALIKKSVIRRTFKSKKSPDAPPRKKAPKIQRLITQVRIRRKRIQKQSKIKRWKKTIAATQQYKKLYDQWMEKKKKITAQAKQARKDSESVKQSKDKDKDKAPTKQKKPAQAKDKKPATTKTEPPKKTQPHKKPAAAKKPQPPKTATQTKPPAPQQPPKKK